MHATRTCSIDGCERPFVARGLCNPHYVRARKDGSLADAPRFRPQPGECSVDGCEIRGNRRGMCRKHYQRWVNHADPTVVLQAWHSHEVGYSGMHMRLREQRGSASDHQCVDCGHRAAEWSYKGGDPDERLGENHGRMCPYSLDPDYYEPRCVRCHRIYDESVGNL